MIERPYESEDVLQALLAEHPEVLVGTEREGAGHGWLLVRREAGGDAMDSSGRWSLDYLFLDAAGVPTLVEVKRGSDTRSRREVVAQMLDYAANATAFWKIELLRAWFESECERQGTDGEAALERAFGIDDCEGYWARVQTNLAADRIRLVFVSDAIAPELRSIVEFLNRQMSETEVLAIEVKQYVDADGQHQTIVPRVVGRTEAARAAKSAVGRAATSSDLDFATAPAAFHELIEKMDALAAQLNLEVVRTRTGRNYRPAVPEPDARETSGIGVYASASGTEFNLAVFRELGANELADQLLDRLRDVTALQLQAPSWSAMPCEALLGTGRRVDARSSSRTSRPGAVAMPTGSPGFRASALA